MFDFWCQMFCSDVLQTTFLKTPTQQNLSDGMSVKFYVACRSQGGGRETLRVSFDLCIAWAPVSVAKLPCNCSPGLGTFITWANIFAFSALAGFRVFAGCCGVHAIGLLIRPIFGWVQSLSVL